jgi:predicted small secreted protein
MKRLILGVFAAVALVVGISGCATPRGGGEDVEVITPAHNNIPALPATP